jgi:lysyl-tRNA synthetase class 2
MSTPTGGRSCWSRNRIKAAFRAWFEARDFLEVDTAALQVSPGNEAHLHAFARRRP